MCKISRWQFLIYSLILLTVTSIKHSQLSKMEISHMVFLQKLLNYLKIAMSEKHFVLNLQLLET